MEQTFLAFKAAYDQKPWQPGIVDCCLALASWAIWLGHSDPADHLRGRYSDEDGFRGIIEGHGGVQPLVGYCCSKISAKRVQHPMCGDIAVIGSGLNFHKQFGAIFDGERWQVRLKPGFSPLIAKPLSIWRL